MSASMNTSSFALISKGDMVGIALRAIFVLLGICSNITVIAVLVRNFKRENFTLKLMLNLAVSDIICLSMVAAWMYNLLFGWKADTRWCQLTCFVTYTSAGASVFIVTLMSVQRYVVVLYRQQWSKLGSRGELAVLVLMWGLGGGLSAFSVSTYGVVVENGTNPVCEQIFRSEEQKFSFLLLETTYVFVIPFTIMLASYVCLHKKVTEKAMTSPQRLAKLVTCIVGTFFIFWIPYHIVNVMIMVAPRRPTQSVLKMAYSEPRRIVQAIVYMNSCVNPFLYAFNYRSLRPTKPKTADQTPQTSNEFT